MTREMRHAFEMQRAEIVLARQTSGSRVALLLRTRRPVASDPGFTDFERAWFRAPLRER